MLSSTTGDRWMGPDTSVREDEHLEREAQVAFSLIEKWGLIAAVPDGEDAAGRQKGRMMTPDELVDRAFAVAAAAMGRARTTGLIHKVTFPTAEDVAAAEAARDAARLARRTEAKRLATSGDADAAGE